MPGGLIIHSSQLTTSTQAMSRRESYQVVYDDLLTGSLFKQPFFRKAKPMTNGWTKRFFVFNRKNMLLQVGETCST